MDSVAPATPAGSSQPRPELRPRQSPPEPRQPPPSAETAGAASPGTRPALLVCSGGGHLTQLLALRHWWGTRNRAWVTSDGAHARSALRGESISWGHFPTTRNAGNLVRNFFLALRLLGPRSRRPSVIVSTGAGLAVPFFVLGWLIRIPTVYIEVFDRVDSRTLTGRLCRPFTSLFLVQWEEQRVLYRDAVVAGELLWCGDGREPEPGPAGQVSGPSPAPGTQAPLLLVTVGTDHHPFTRLITWVEDWLADGGDQRVRVLIQHGDTPVAAADGRIGQLDFDELQAALRSASIVITHAGATVMEARNAGRLPIVVPRRAELGEHVDGHQVRFCQWLDAKGLAVICDTEDKLRAALDRAVAAATAGTGLAAGLPAAGQVPSSSGTRDLVPAGPRRAGELIDTLLARRSPGKARKPTRAGRPVDG